MKAFLLAGGEGRRLRPLTLQMPKCMVPIGGKPLLEIWYRHLEKMGVLEVLINISNFPEQVYDFVESLETPIKSHIIHEQKLNGSAGTLLINKDFIINEPFFWIIYSDNLTNTDLTNLLFLHKDKDPHLTMGLFHTNVPKESGIVTLDDDSRIIEFIEKPENPKSNLANAGIMLASPKIIEMIPDHIPCDMSYDVIPNLVGRMYGQVIEDFYIDIGTPEKYQLAQEEWQELEPKFFNVIN
jgi:mannose-1-phosphate guanylyltransferase